VPSLPTRLVAGAVRCWCDAHYISHRGSLVPPPSSPLLPRQPHATSPHWGAADGSLSVATGDLDAAGEDDGRMFYRNRQVLLRGTHDRQTGAVLLHGRKKWTPAARRGQPDSSHTAWPTIADEYSGARH
jgi:hypothetical protein